MVSLKHGKKCFQSAVLNTEEPSTDDLGDFANSTDDDDDLFDVD